MLLRNLAIAAAFCASSTQAFAPAATSVRVPTARNLMSAEEVKAIIDEAESCAAGECALDEVEALITNLQSQQSLLSKRVSEMDKLIKDLEHANGRDNRPTDEVRETVKAIFRIFALGVSSSHLLSLDVFSCRHHLMLCQLIISSIIFFSINFLHNNLVILSFFLSFQTM